MTKLTHPDRPVDVPFLRFALNFKGRRFGNNSMVWAIIVHAGAIAALVYLWLADSWHWFAPVFLFFVLAATWVATAIQWMTIQKRAWRRWAEMLESPRGSHSYTDPDSGPGPFAQTEIGESAGGTWFGITAPWFDSPLWLTDFPGYMYGPEVLRRLNQAYDKGRKSIRP